MSVLERHNVPAWPTDRLVTAEELADHPEWEYCELIRGKVVPLSPPKAQHGILIIEIGAILRDFVKPRKLGRILGADSGLLVERGPDTVHGPDVAFISAGRLKNTELNKYVETPPELCIEVVSPTDRWTEITEKVDMFLGMGVVLVWVIDPKTRKAHVYRKGRETLVVDGDGIIDGEDVLFGFRLSMKDVFAALIE